MTRFLAFVVHNWPLKLAAVVLASLLYGVIVLTQDTRVFDQSVQIERVNQSEDLVLLSDLGDVRRIRYFASDDVLVDSSSFRAVVDLAGPNIRAGTIPVAVRVTAIDPRVDVVDWEPRRISITLDDIIEKEVDVEVNMATPPTGLDIRPAEASEQVATVRGAASDVRRVVRTEARIQLEPSGLNFDRDVDLVPVDALGEVVQQVDVEPATVHVTVPVFTELLSRSLPVRPVVTGTPATGFEVTSVTYQPLVVTVEGDANELETLTVAPTDSISVDGITEAVSQTVGLDLPTGVLPVGPEEITVTIAVRQVSETRTFVAGIALGGARGDRTYRVSTDSVLLTVGGTVADLDALEARTLQVQAPVQVLDAGVHEVPIVADLPPGLALLGASPPTVTVTVGLPPQPSVSAGAATAPAASP